MPAPRRASRRFATTSNSEAPSHRAAAPEALAPQRAARRLPLSPRLSPSTFALLLAPPLFWAGNAVVARAVVGEFPPLALSFARWALAFVLLLPFVWSSLPAALRQLRGRWMLMAVISALGVGCYNSLQYLALQTSTAVNATLIGASAPVMTLLTGAAFFAAPVRVAQWLGSALSLVGVLVVISRGDLMNLARLHLDRGDLIMLVATFTWAIYTWLLRTRRPPVAAAAFLALLIGLGALMILPFAVIEYLWTRQLPTATPTNLMALLYVAVFPSLVAYFCWDRGVSRAGAILPMYFLNLTPVFTGALSYLTLGDPIGLHHLLGGALIIAGIHLAGRQRGA